MGNLDYKQRGVAPNAGTSATSTNITDGGDAKSLKDGAIGATMRVS